VRSDRWYKLGRTILYGRLEDEAPFASVRQLVEHEDYMLRLASSAGLPVPATYGFVELTPAREYLIVMEQLPDAHQIGPGIVVEPVIDDALACVRQLWDAGIAHRDIKPANLMVARDGVHLVDLSFAEVRATPWREAVDLATMMLTLGLFAPPQVVYERALRLFEPDEIGEAFAAARSVTIPSQLRSLIRLDAPGLAEQFRSLAPPHGPISIQRWSMQRVLLSGVVALAVCSATALLIFNLETAGLL
jgi:tRNA A-37 threonylcarbamoyl transferase component Bud32